MERTEQDMIENKRAENTGLYDPSFEHDNCGIGAVVNIKGIKTHDTVNNALKIVENLEHRAGKDAEGKTGMDMVKLEKYQGFAADLSAALCILLSTVCGIPVSTTHVKTTAIMGVGAEKRASAINLKVVRDMVLAWVLTFPGCGVIGYGMAKLLIVWLG